MTFIATLFALITIACAVVYLGCFVAMHLMKTGYSPVSHAVSDYARGATSSVARLSVLLSGGMVLACAGLLVTGFPNFHEKSEWIWMLVVVAFARFGLRWMRTDIEGDTKTREGRIHMVLAVTHFALTLVVMRLVTHDFLAHVASWAPMYLWLDAIVLVATVSTIVLVTGLVIKPLYRYIFGLSERVFLLSQAIWFVMVAVSFFLYGF